MKTNGNRCSTKFQVLSSLRISQGALAASDKCHTARFTAQSSHTQVLIGDIHGLTLSRAVAILMIGSFVPGILAKKKLEPKTVPPQGVSS